MLLKKLCKSGLIYILLFSLLLSLPTLLSARGLSPGFEKNPLNNPFPSLLCKMNCEREQPIPSLLIGLCKNAPCLLLGDDINDSTWIPSALSNL